MSQADPHNHPDRICRLTEQFYDIVDLWLELDSKPREFNTGHTLTVSEIHTIDAIGRVPKLNINELAAHMKVTKGAASQMVSKLVKKDLVEKYKAEDNAKEVLLRLTPLGQKGFDAHMAYHRQTVGIFEQYYGNDLANGIERLERNLNEIFDILKLHQQQDTLEN